MQIIGLFTICAIGCVLGWEKDSGAHRLLPCKEGSVSSEWSGWYRRRDVDSPWRYKFWYEHDMTLTWPEAVFHCRNDSSELFWLDDKEELMWVREVTASFYFTKNLFLNAHRTAYGSGGNIPSWITGKPMDPVFPEEMHGYVNYDDEWIPDYK